MVCPGVRNVLNDKPNTGQELYPDDNTEILQFFYGLLQNLQCALCE